MSMRAGHSSKRSYDQNDADIDPLEPSQQYSESSPHQSETEIGVDGFWQSAADAESEVDGYSQRALSGCRDHGEVKTDAGKSSKRPCLEGRYLLDCHKPSHSSATREPWPTNDSDSPFLSKAIHPSSPHIDAQCLQDPQAFLPRKSNHSSSTSLPPPLPNRNHALEPNPSSPPPSRPTFIQLSNDGQQGIKVLFLIDHATKGDAIHHNISAYIHSDSSQMKLLMAKYQHDRSYLQSRYFSKARIICAQLTSRPEFVTLAEKRGNRDRRLEYFSENCTKAHLATLYSHLGSAVDFPRILAARTLNDKAFKDLMTQVFVHSMEDLWCLEFHPSKRNSSAKLERENKEEIYNRFRNLTDRVDGLPAAKVTPGYFEIPLKAGFPRYVLFDQGLEPWKWGRCWRE